MDYIKEAKKLGFSNAAIMDTQKLVFKPEYRKFCEENQCGCYNVNPACPPECGTVESMKQRVFAYEKALILQTIQNKDMPGSGTEKYRTFFCRGKGHHREKTDPLNK